MPIEYTNSVRATYRLLETKTKKGKSHYFFSANPDSKGTPVEKIPEGFEIYEHPANSQVFLRKKRPQLITELEKHLVETQVEKLKRDQRYRVDCKDKEITIYESNANVGNLQNILGNLLEQFPIKKDAGLKPEQLLDDLVNTVTRDYSPIMKFTLVDDKRRTFAAQRFCFKGAVDDWISIGGPADLQKLVKKFVPTLETDDFFELY